MQTPDAFAEARPNWALGLRALVIAAALASVSRASGSELPMYVAVLVAGWAVVKPLRVGHLVLSRTALRWGGTTAAKIVALLVAAFVLSFAVNSSVPVIAMLGNALFLGLVVLVASMAARYVWTRTRATAPRAWSLGGEAVDRARVQVAAALAATLTR